MGNFQIVEHDGIRVLTTKQLAEAYEVDPRKISYNFNHNKERYIEGKHYIALSGEEKKAFLNRREFHDGSQNAKFLYLWTEKGCFLAAKSLNTDKAWEAYDRLIDEYFAVVKEKAIDRMNEQAAHINGKTPTLLPKALDWYSRNRWRILRICHNSGMTHSEVYHALLRFCGTEYDLNAAREIYRKERGYYPVYPVDIIGHFPQLEEMADVLLDLMIMQG